MAALYVKISSKNQITLPQAIVRQFPGASYFEIAERDNEVVLRPMGVAVLGKTLERVREKIRGLGLTENIVSKVVRNVRKAR